MEHKYRVNHGIKGNQCIPVFYKRKQFYSNHWLSHYCWRSEVQAQDITVLKQCSQFTPSLLVRIIFIACLPYSIPNEFKPVAEQKSCSVRAITSTSNYIVTLTSTEPSPPILQQNFFKVTRCLTTTTTIQAISTSWMPVSSL
jgi:hypothetical protein